MENWRKKLGCLVWIMAILFVSAVAGWGAHRGLANIQPEMPIWLNVASSVAAGVFALLVLGVISFLVIVGTDKDWDKV